MPCRILVATSLHWGLKKEGKVWKVSAVMARHRIHHAPPFLRCPSCKGQARDLFYHSTYRTRAGPRLLWQCRLCGRCLSERRGTAFFNLKTAEVESARSPP